MRQLPAYFLAALLFTLTACGDAEYADYKEDTTPESYAVSADSPADQAQHESDLAIQTYDVADKTVANGESDPEVPRAIDQRKIIYNANIDLVVDAFEDVPGEVQALVKKHGGFIANSSIRGSEGEPRTGTWTLRIPSANYDAFVAGSKSLGQVRSVTTDTREVTAEYVDLESRIRNLKTEEQRLNKHLQDSTGKLDEILKVEREISRVRGEIERHEGRLNVLKDLTSLSTVTLTIQEIKDYVPEPTEEPGYGTKVARTWNDSLGAFGQFMTGLSLAIVALVPWLILIVPIGVVAWLVIRTLIRKASKAISPKAHPVG